MVPVNRKQKRGRPSEGREKVTCYILPETRQRVKKLIDDQDNSVGKVIDRKFQNTK